MKNIQNIDNNSTPSQAISVAAEESLSAVIERVTYHNIDNGFCVLRTTVKGRKDLVTIIGNVPAISVGEQISCTGIWNNDKNHGLQFKASVILALKPSSLDAIEKYLGSGLIKGIGPHFAKKLIQKFGSDVFDIIEKHPEKLLTVENIGTSRANSICANWKGQKVVREIMIFLQSHGVSTSRATRIYKIYGERAIEIVSENPYKLAQDVRGIGFISADAIARNLGIAKDSLIRARAGVHHALLESALEGHCGVPHGFLLQTASSLLEMEEALIEEAIIHEIDAGFLTKDRLDDVDAIFLPGYYLFEKNSSEILLNMLEGEVPWGKVDVNVSTEWVEKELDITLAEVQKIALSKALQTKVMVITGGPGTGKTTLVNSILTILKAQKLRLKLCAPTGRAARRLSESTGLEASTIHRLLEIDPISDGFKRNQGNKLECDYLVIDEVSMVDIQLFHSLLEAMPQNAALLLVGDVDQLPSVRAGQVLKDIIESGKIVTTKLTEIFRQAATSNIITNAHLVNQGEIPNLDSPASAEVLSDFYFIPAEPGDNLIQKLIEIITKRIPARFGFHPLRDIQILTPMQKWGTGARSLNIELQKVLNPSYESGVLKFGEYFAVGDKVMQTENNYDKEVYNGDMGEVKSINALEQEVIITFYNKDIIYDYSDLDQITLAYATTIHKSQGSEYPVVIIPLTTQSYRMLKRNLIYTAITRGKKLVIIIGEKKAIAIAVKNSTNNERYTKLKSWLQTARDL